MKLSEGGQFEIPDSGSYRARCYGIIDLGTQQHSYGGESWLSRDLRLLFELPEERMTGKFYAENKGKPFMVGLTAKASLHPNSKLRPLLESWRGRKFTKEESAGFDIKNLIGAPCRLSIVQDGNYANVSSISPLGKGEVCPTQINQSIYFSLVPEEFDQKTFMLLPERTREKIAKSPEYIALMNGSDPGEPAPASAPSGNDSDDTPF